MKGGHRQTRPLSAPSSSKPDVAQPDRLASQPLGPRPCWLTARPPEPHLLRLTRRGLHVARR